MASVNVSIVRSSSLNRFGNDLPVAGATSYGAVKVTSAAGSAAVTLSGSYVPKQWQDVWEVTASGGSIWVTFGPPLPATAPTAAAGTSRLVLDGQTRWFGVDVDGQVMAFCDGP